MILRVLLLAALCLAGCGRAPLRFPSVPVPTPCVPDGDPPTQQPPAQLRGTLA